MGKWPPAEFISCVAMPEMMNVRGKRCHLMFIFRIKQVAEQPMFEHTTFFFFHFREGESTSRTEGQRERERDPMIPWP